MPFTLYAVTYANSDTEDSRRIEMAEEAGFGMQECEKMDGWMEGGEK